MKIRVIDIETTGLAPPEHTVIEIGWCDVCSTDTEAKWGVHSPHAVFVDPERPIPPEASAIHHILEEDIDRPGLPQPRLNWREVALVTFDGEMEEIGKDKVGVLCAHNIKFERQWCTDDLTYGKPWICTHKCALRLWPDAPNHQNQTLRYWRRPAGLRRDLVGDTHRAGPDAYVTAHLLREMLAEATVGQLIGWSNAPARLVKCGFGKHRGQLWSDIPSDYLQWIARQRDMDEDVLFTAKDEMVQRRHR